MKYIATSTLNIDNILSTESISPISFYEQRDFGYKSFWPLSQTSFDNLIILFSEIPFFEINDLERENHPLVLQIDDEEQLQNCRTIGKFNKCEVFAFNNTIHINPTNCKILFFSKKAIFLSHQNCMSSKFNKLFKYYKFEIVKTPKYSLDKLVKSINKEVLETITLPTFVDNTIDKVKGFITGYYLGSKKEMTPETAEIVSKAIQIANIVNARISNRIAEEAIKREKKGKYIPTNTELIEHQLAKLENELNNNDPAKKKASFLWRKQCSEEKEEILKEYDVLTEAKNKFIQKEGIIVYKKTNSFWTEDDYLDYLQKYIDKLTPIKKVNVAKEINVNADFTFNINDDSDISKLFIFLLKRISDLNIVDLRTNRTGIVTFFGRTLGEYYGLRWKESAERMYWGTLKHNVDYASPFDVKATDNIILRSLAAFVLKGEDFVSLVEYLDNNAIAIYKYALAFWGISLGYVKISRTILENDIEELYPQLYKILNKKEIQLKLEPANIEISPKPSINFASLFNNDSFKIIEPKAQKYYKDEIAKIQKDFIPNDDNFKELEQLYKKCPTKKKYHKEWEACVKWFKQGIRLPL